MSCPDSSRVRIWTINPASQKAVSTVAITVLPTVREAASGITSGTTAALSFTSTLIIATSPINRITCFLYVLLETKPLLYMSSFNLTNTMDDTSICPLGTTRKKIEADSYMLIFDFRCSCKAWSSFKFLQILNGVLRSHWIRWSSVQRRMKANANLRLFELIS